MSETCLVVGCEIGQHCRGMCVKHYHQYRRSQYFSYHEPVDAPCTVEGCTRQQKAHGLCNTHYQRQRRERLRVQCQGRKLHAYSPLGRCVYCGAGRTRKYVVDPRTSWHKAKAVDGQ